MKKQTQTFIFPLLILAILFSQIPQIKSQNNNNNQQQKQNLQEEYYGQITEDGHVDNFVVSIPNIYEAKFLLFTAQGITTDSEPEIFVSTTKKEVKTKKDAQYYAEPSQLAITYVTPEQIAKNKATDYNLGVKCAKACTYKLTVFYEEDVEMNMNDDTRYIYVDEDIEHLRIQVERDLFNTFLTEFELINPFEVKQPFNAYINTDRESYPTKSSYQYVGKGWGSGNGQGVFFREGDEICDECTYYISLKAAKGSIIRVSTFSYNKVRLIQPYQIVNDFTKKKQVKQFQLRLSELQYSIDFSKESLVFALINFQGEADLYLNQGNCPENLNDFQWKSALYGDDRIIITPEERDLNENKFCIKVATEDFALFSLNIFSLNSEKLLLQWDYPESGSVKTGEIVNYKLSVDGNENFKMRIDMEGIDGLAEIYVKQCQNSIENCKITQKDIDNKKMQKDLKWSNKHDFDTLEIDHDGSKCHQNSDFSNETSVKRCNYVIGVYGAEGKNKEGKKIEKSSYIIRASHDAFHTVIVENNPIHHYVEAGAINYYKFYLSNVSQVQQLKIEVTNLHGDVTLFSSTQNEWPTIDDKEKISFWNSIIYDTKDLKSNEKLQGGNYFIGIQGDQPVNSYTISVKVKTLESGGKTFYKLKQGRPAEFSFTSESDRTYFQINTDEQTDKSYIQVNLQGQLRRFKFYISTNKNNLPNEIVEKFGSGYQSEHGQIILPKGASKTSDNGKFYGVIIPDSHSQIDKNGLKCQFGFYVNNVQDLTLGSMNQMYMGEQQTRYFKLELLSSESLSISKKTTKFFQGLVQIYGKISAGEQETYPSKEDHEFKLDNFDTTFLTEELISKECPQLNAKLQKPNQALEKCFVFLTAETYEETNFYLYAEKNSAQVMIYPDIGQRVTLNPIEGAIRGAQREVYMFVTPGTERMLVNFSKCKLKHSPIINVNFVKLDENTSRSDWKWPSGAVQKQGYDSDLTMFMNYLQGFEIDYQTLSKHGCNESSLHSEYSCVLLMTIYEDSKHDENFEIELTVNTGIRYLIEGDYTVSSMPENSVNYYEFEVINETDQIEVKTDIWSKGKAQVSVIKADELKADIDFKSGFQSSKLENRVVINKENSKEKLIGNYIVAVFSYEHPLQYSITYTLGTKKSFQKIETGYPIEIFLGKDHSNYYLYQPQINHQAYTAFRILTSEQFGEVNTQAIIVDLDSDYVSNIDSLSPDFKKSKKNSHNLVNVDEKSLNEKCHKLKKCGVIIKTQSKSFSKATILIEDTYNYQVYLPTDIKIKDQLLQKEFVMINLLNDQEVNLNLHVYQGEIQIQYRKVDGSKFSKQISADNTGETLLIPTVQYKQRTVTITAVKDAIFTYQTQLIGADSALSYGTPHHFQLQKAGTDKKFTIPVYPDNAYGNIEVSIQHPYTTTQKFTQLYTDLEVNFFFVSDETKQTQRVSSISKINQNENYLYVLPAFKIKGKLIIDIAVRAMHVNTVQTYITVSQQGLSQMILPNFQQRGIGYSGGKKIYEIIIPQNQYLLIETANCLGNAQFIFSTDLEQIQKRKSNLNAEIVTANTYQQYLMIKNPNPSQNTVIFIGVITDYDDIVYSITPYLFLNSQDIPLTKIRIPQSTEVIKARADDEKERLKFLVPPIFMETEQAEQSGYEIQGYYYQYLMVDEENTLDQVAMCKSRKGQELIPQTFYFFEQKREVSQKYIARQDVSQFRLGFSIYKNQLEEWTDYKLEKQIYFKVVAHIVLLNTETNVPIEFRIPYETTLIQTAELFPEQYDQGSILKGLLFGIFWIFVIIFVLFVARYTWNRFKHREQYIGAFDTFQSNTSFYEQ